MSAGVGTPAVAPIADDARPSLGPGFRLQWEEVQKAHVLLFPEGMVRLNPSAGEIMKRCDGTRSLVQIVDELQAAFSTSGLRGDVAAFCEMAAKQGWLRWS